MNSYTETKSCHNTNFIATDGIAPLVFSALTAETYGVIITSLLSQNDIVTSFSRNNDVIITPFVHWELDIFARCCLIAYPS